MGGTQSDLPPYSRRRRRGLHHHRNEYESAMTGPRNAEDERPILAPPQRVSGMRVPEADAWSLPGKPDGLDVAAEDAWRQTGFVLGSDVRLIESGLRLQLRLAGSGYAPAARTMAMAAYASLWS